MEEAKEAFWSVGPTPLFFLSLPLIASVWELGVGSGILRGAPLWVILREGASLSPPPLFGNCAVCLPPPLSAVPLTSTRGRWPFFAWWKPYSEG